MIAMFFAIFGDGSFDKKPVPGLQGKVYINEVPLRMYCIDTKALVFMFNGGSSYGSTIPLNKQ